VHQQSSFTHLWAKKRGCEGKQITSIPGKRTNGLQDAILRGKRPQLGLTSPEKKGVATPDRENRQRVVNEGLVQAQWQRGVPQNRVKK